MLVFTDNEKESVKPHFWERKTVESIKRPMKKSLLTFLLSEGNKEHVVLI